MFVARIVGERRGGRGGGGTRTLGGVHGDQLTDYSASTEQRDACATRTDRTPPSRGKELMKGEYTPSSRRRVFDYE